MNPETHRRLGKLVSELTTSGSTTLEPTRLREIKKICRLSDAYVQAIFALLMTQLSKQHAQIRLAAFLIARELFDRSHAFRELVAADLRTFLDRTIGTDVARPLPPPQSTAASLKSQTLAAIHEWHAKYGARYKKLEIGYRYLTHAKKIDLAAVDAELNARQVRENAQRERRLAAIRQKVQIIGMEMKDMMPEIEHCLQEMTGCFELLLPKPETFFARTQTEEKEEANEDDHDVTFATAASSTTSEDNNEERVSSDDESREEESGDESSGEQSDSRDSEEEKFLQSHGLVSKGFSLSLTAFNTQAKVNVDETEDTAPIIASLRDDCKLIVQKFLPAVNRWLKTVGKSDDQAKLKELLDVKELLNEAKTRYEMFCFDSNGKGKPKVKDNEEGNVESDDTDDDLLEDVPEKEGVENAIIEDFGLARALRDSIAESCSSNQAPPPVSSSSSRFVGFSPDDPTSSAAQIRALSSRLKPSRPSLQSSNPAVADERKAELLRQAPVVEYGLDLHYNWESEGPSDYRSANKTETFWANQDTAVDESVERQASETRADGLKSRVIEFSGTFEPATQMCRAPLSNGKLCPRMDKVKCPFHGIIVPRDEMGKAVGENVATADEVTWEDIEEEVMAGVGISLPSRKRKGKSRRGSKLGRKSSGCGPGLIDLKTKEDTSRSRLAGKMLKGKTVKRVAMAMDGAEHRRNAERFGHQWNYSLRK